MNKWQGFIFLIPLFLILVGCTQNSKYFNQQPPGYKPELFANSIVNTDSIELNVVFNASFTEMYFTRIINKSFIIHHSELIHGNWTLPQPIHMFANKDSISVAVDMTITQDGNTMYFLGINPKDFSHNSLPDIYQSRKINGQWQLASKVEYPISTDEYTESYPLVVADGSLYFLSDRPGGKGKRDLYRAQYKGDGKFETPISISSVINSEGNEGTAYVAPDESFLVASNNNHPNKKGFYVSFKNNKEWQAPIYIDIGEAINEEWIYFCPYMSPDNKYLFFSRRYSEPPESGWSGVKKGEVYWVDADVIFNLKE